MRLNIALYLGRADAGINSWRGWRKNIFIFALGAFASLSLPPLYWFPCFIVAAAYLYRLLPQAASYKQAALWGFLFQFGYFTTSLYWISAALLIDPGSFAWMLPFSIFGLPAVLAIFGAVWIAAARGLAKKTPYYSPAHLFGFCAAHIITEYARGHVLTGFPWNLPGYNFGFHDYWLQSASVAGVYGLTFIACFFAAALAAAMRGKYKPIILAALIFAAMGIYGAARLENAETQFVDGVYLRIVQPNIPQKLKWDRTAVRQNFYQYLNMSAQQSAVPVTHIIWPETAVPFPVDLNRGPRMEMARILRGNQSIIFGAPRADYDSIGQVRNLYNSVMAIDRDGDIVFEYDKAHLVPFGEYVPLPEWLGVRKIVSGMTDYTPGSGRKTVSVPGLPPFSPSICYEAIFPGQVVDPHGGAKWMINVTNDGWYGRTAGPYQHLAHAQMRAVEEGLPMIRSAGTGISAVIDAYGRILKKLDLGESGVLDTGLPKDLGRPTLYQTIYSGMWNTN